jgi:large subunit ribosomal protein L25
MAGIVLEVDVRAKVGGGGPRQTRAQDKVPGVLYGGPRGPVSIEVGMPQLVKALRSGKFISHLITLEHKGERQPVIPRAIQYHPVTDEPIHFDLYRVEENSVIDIEVPVHFKNHELSPGLKRGGALNVVEHTLKLKVPAGRIPEEIVIDLDGLDIGAVIHLSAIALPPGCTPVVRDKDPTVAGIVGRGKSEEEPKKEG